MHWISLFDPRTGARFSENQSAPKLENRKTSPCSPRAPNLLHVLPSRMVGWNELCNPDYKVKPLICNLQIINSEVQITNQKLQIKKSWITNFKYHCKNLPTTAFHGQWNFIMVCKGPLRQHKGLPLATLFKLYNVNIIL